MMKQLFSLALALSLSAAAIYSVPHGSQEKEKQTDKPAQTPEKAPPKQVEPPPIKTFKGQVVDLACYLANDGALGGDHQECAEACVKAGATTGYQTADRTYLVLRDPMHQKDMPDLSKFVNKPTEITAQIYTHDGIQALKVLTIK